MKELSKFNTITSHYGAGAGGGEMRSAIGILKSIALLMIKVVIRMMPPKTF